MRIARAGQIALDRDGQLGEVAVADDASKLPFGFEGRLPPTYGAQAIGGPTLAQEVQVSPPSRVPS